MGVTHSKVSAVADGADASLVRPSDWNAAHVHDHDSAFALTADITPTALSANVDDYNPTGLSGASRLRVATNSGTQRNITGLEGGSDGRVLLITNLGPGLLGLIDESTLSTAPNRFALGGTAGDYLLPVDAVVELVYDATSSRWRAVRGATAAGSPTATVGTSAAAGSSPLFLAADATIAHEAGHTAHDTLWAAKGDLAVATANDTAVVLGVGANGSRLVADSTTSSGLAWRAIRLSSLVAVGSPITTTEAVMLTGTIPANTLAAGDSIKVRAFGKITTGVTPGTGTWNIRVGPTTLTGNIAAQGSLTLIASRTDKSWGFDALVNVFTIGGSGTISGSTFLDGRVSPNDTLSGPPYMLSAAAVAIDTTVQNLMELTFVSTQAGSSATIYNGLMERV